ncbi:hypothetical protein L2E82_35559 [Cichorium intybus]|uniref:Uncharacterized protein n=1 Tax=Cichorium intybus TaxID=13427 RepID=A0ACB9BP41_CICIN|nr:hypothetical protein L2E82_35559 [Cichorium intybus]
METASILLGKVVDLVFLAAKREIDYVRNCTENVEKLKREAQNLTNMKDIVQQRINEGKGKGHLLVAGVQNWIEKADAEISTTGKFLEEEANAKKTCCKLRTLHRYGKMATRKTHLLLQIHEDGKIYDNCVSIPAPTPSIVDLYERKNLDDIYAHNILPGVYEESFNGLKSLLVVQCPDVSCLVKTRDRDGMQTFDETKPMEQFFSQVEEITLENLSRMKFLWDCPNQYISFRNLQTIKLEWCYSLLTLFPVSVAQGLVNLSDIDIQYCYELVAVISTTDVQTTGSEIEQTGRCETERAIHDADILFPCLTKINLSGLSRLESFYSGHSTIRYPSLKFIHISDCPRMTTWSYGVHDIPKIKFHHQGTECSINDIIADKASGYIEFGSLKDD